MKLPKQPQCGAKGPNGAICACAKGHPGKHWGHSTVTWDNKRLK